MELKTKYQYSYFIYPYIINEEKYDKYLLKLLKDKHCKLKIFEKEKNLNLYTYFLPNMREYLFWSFSYSKSQIKKLDELDEELKSVLLSKYPCTIFEYDLGNDAQGKVGETNGIFFNVRDMQIICFQTGECFILIKTIIEGSNSFSDVLNFNYKFRDINSEFVSLKDYENIRIQTNSFKDIKDLSNIIKNITGINKDIKEINIDNERFFTYTYTCIEQEKWNKEEDFENIKEEFSKYINILPNSQKTNINNKNEEYEILKDSEFVKIGITKQGTALLTSSKNIDNYTKLPYIYEQEYLYTYIFMLYKRICLKKMNIEFKKNKNLEKVKNKFIEFTKNIWVQEITEDSKGSILSKKLRGVFELEYLYMAIKNKYDTMYKNIDINKMKKTNYIILAILALSLIFNVINFILLFLKH